MKTIMTLLVLSVAIFTACEKTENFQLSELPEAPNPVEGNWREVEPEGLWQFEGTTFTELDLNDDYSFTLSYKKWSDILRAGDPCLGIQDFFVKGTYTLSAKTIQLDGCFTDEGLVNCVAKCDGQTSFLETYQYVFDNDSLILNPDAHPIERHVLVKR